MYNTACFNKQYMYHLNTHCQYSQTCLSCTTWEPKNCPYYRGILIPHVHLYCNGTTSDCPYYRGVLINPSV